jgi:predicted small lipoprotein YifL
MQATTGELGDLMSRSLKLMVVLGLTAFALVSCGKRGALEPPASQDNATSVQPKPKDKPHRSNPLDGLLR